MDSTPRFWTATKQKTLYFLLGSAVLSIGTPAIVAATQAGARFYLLQPIVFVAQVIPNLVATALWLPWPSARASKVALLLARIFFFASALFYIPVMTGILPTSGDMIALGYVLFAMVTVAAILVATVVAFAVSWILARRTKRTDAATPVL